MEVVAYDILRSGLEDAVLPEAVDRVGQEKAGLEIDEPAVIGEYPEIDDREVLQGAVLRLSMELGDTVPVIRSYVIDVDRCRRIIACGHIEYRSIYSATAQVQVKALRVVAQMIQDQVIIGLGETEYRDPVLLQLRWFANADTVDDHIVRSRSEDAQVLYLGTARPSDRREEFRDPFGRACEQDEFACTGPKELDDQAFGDMAGRSQNSDCGHVPA
jgi:hypothetical protein